MALLTQYLPLSLNEHIGSGKPWDFDRRDTGVTMLQLMKNQEEMHGIKVLLMQSDRILNLLEIENLNMY